MIRQSSNEPPSENKQTTTSTNHNIIKMNHRKYRNDCDIVINRWLTLFKRQPTPLVPNNHNDSHYHHHHPLKQQQLKHFDPYHLCCSNRWQTGAMNHSYSSTIAAIMPNPTIGLFPSRSPKRQTSSYNVISIFLLLILSVVMSSIQGDVKVHCPHVNLIHRLTAPNGAPVNRHSSQILNITPECDCTVIQEGGWEITCYASVDENDEDAKSSALSKWPKSEEYESMDYGMIDYDGELHYSFTVRYEMVRQLIKIDCYKGTPAFKPALFQGFGIDSIDTFVISKCELPQTLPLSVILYRTQTHGFSMSSAVGSHSFSINTTGQADIVSPIRTLYLKSPKRVSIKQLNTLLSDLESLEELKLSDFDLSDIDSYAIETYDTHSSSGIDSFPNPYHAKRVKRNNMAQANSFSPLTTTASPIDLMAETTISPLFEMTKIDPDTSDDSHMNVTISMPRVNNAKIMEDKIIINETSDDEVTTTVSPMTTILSDSNIIDIVQPGDIINTTTNGLPENDGINFEEDNINNVNLENKPIFVLDENVLNFARILPNLKTLVLEDFVKESNIPNVLFQIIKGLDKLEELRLNQNNLETIPNNALVFAGSSLKQLYLQHNSIKEIDVNAFKNLSHLEVLDISHNKLTHLNDYTFKPLKNLQFLRMHNNQFQNLSEYLFQANVKLKSLDLSKNNQLRPLPSNLFQGLSSFSDISMADCNLTSISLDTRQFFRNAPNLSKFDFKGNKITNLTLNGLFSSNSKLTKLDFSSNQIEEIDGAIFGINSSRIVEIILDKNRLTTLPENLFRNARNIRKLSVSSNHLTETSPMTFMKMKMLEELDLSNNQITTLNTQTDQLPFGIGGYLRKVDLSYNHLSDFDSEINGINWPIYVSFSELNLKNNNFSGILSVPVFLGSKEPLFKLDVSSNYFHSVDVQDILDYMPLKDISQNHTNTETEVRLDNNPFSCDCFLFPFLNYTKLVGRLYNKNYHDSIIRKIIFLIDNTNRIVCHSPENLKNHPLSNVKLSELVCQIDDHRICPTECDCKYRSLDQSAIIDCDNRHLIDIPKEMQLSRFYNISLKGTPKKIPKVQNVVYQLRANKIQSIETLVPMLTWNNEVKLKPKFVEILLDNNNISHLEENLLMNDNPESMVTVKKLSLQNNNIPTIPLKILQTFENYSLGNETVDHSFPLKSKLYLGNNAFDCHNEPAPPGSQCPIRDFKMWLSSHPDLVGDVNSIQCEANSSMIIVNMSDEFLCPILIPPPNNTTLTALSIICVVLASSLFVVSVLYYRNKQTILAFIYIHLNPIFICLHLFGFTEDDLDEEKIYDAFVSYSSSDRDIVMELIEKLEKPHDMNEVSLILQNGLSIHEGKVDQVVPENVFKKGSTLKSAKSDMNVENGENGGYRLCIHERDWLPGNLISWNIVNSVQNSKRTILILSESFIQSIWFQVEFHTAYYQMLEDRIDRLIVIVRGELPPKDQLDKELNVLLTTKTYLVWGEKWFWEKLYYAMRHKKRRPMKLDKSEKDKLTSTMSNTKYNGSLNGRLNGVANDGMLKWSKPNAKAETMKEYVDKTIASHFQLNSYSPSTNSIPTPSSKPSLEPNPKPSNGPSNNNNQSTRPAPKSLRNSGTLATATPNTLKAFNYGNEGFDNKSFIDETNT